MRHGQRAIATLKAQLARELCALVESMHQHHAAAWLGLCQSDLSLLRGEKLERFSLDRLVRLLLSQQYGVEVVLRPDERRMAQRRASPAVKVVRLDRWGRPLPSAARPRSPARGTAVFDDLTSDW